MPAKVFNVLSQLRLDTRDFTTKMKSSAKEVQTFGRKIEKDFRAVSREFGKLGRTASKAFTLPLAGISFAFERTIKGIDGLIKAGKPLNLLGNEMLQLKYIAEDNGTTIEAVSVSFSNFNKLVGLMSGSTRQYLDTIGDGLADELRAADNVRDKMIALGAALKGEAVDGEKAAATMALLGRSGRTLIPILVKGGDAIREMFDNAAKYSIPLTEAESQKIEDMANSFQNLGEQIKRVFFEFIRPLIPAIREMIQGFADGLVVVNNFAQRHSFLAKVFAGTIITVLSLGSAIGTTLLTLATASSVMAWLAGAAAKSSLAARGLSASLLLLKNSAAGAIVPIKLLGSGIVLLTKQIWTLTVAMIANPITLWVTAISLLGLAIGAVLSPRIRQAIVDFRDLVGEMTIVKGWTDLLLIGFTTLWESFKVTGVAAMKAIEDTVIGIAMIITQVVKTLVDAVAFLTGLDMAEKLSADLGKMQVSFQADFDRNTKTFVDSASNAKANISAANDQAVWSKKAADELKGIRSDMKKDRDARAGKPGAIKTDAFAF